MIASMLLMSANNIIDSIWVAGLGADPLAALGFITPLFLILVGIGAGLGAGANSLIARMIGEKKDYEASNAGVKIRLIIRGICCLKTGIAGVSENIHVTSIVGTYLEHARIFYFYNNREMIFKDF